MFKFQSLKHLVISDKLYQTVDKETFSHISARKGDDFYEKNWYETEIYISHHEEYFLLRILMLFVSILTPKM